MVNDVHKQYYHRATKALEMERNLSFNIAFTGVCGLELQHTYTLFPGASMGVSGFQCFDAVGWVSGRHLAHKNPTDEALLWLSSEAKCK